MLDDKIRSAISQRLPAQSNKARLISLAFAAYMGGIATAGALWLAFPALEADDLAKLAALASSSTGQPAASLWLDASASAPWPWQRDRLASRLLVDIDVGRCAIRQAAN